MQLPAPFEPVGDHIGIALVGGRALFTTRRGGVSRGPYASLNLEARSEDDPAAVRRNRELVAAIVGVPLDAVVEGRQVHGARVERVSERPEPERVPPEVGAVAIGEQRPEPGRELPEADGHATSCEGLALLVLAADCLPIALVAPGAIAMLHAGWRGLAAGVVEEGVRVVRELAGGAELQAAIGPGAGGCCYEVGAEVHAAVGGLGVGGSAVGGLGAGGSAVGGSAVGGSVGGGAIDLKAIARERLERAGVAQVHDAGVCTICAAPELFFSHRREGVTGRQAGIAWRS